ncbi:ABC transporter permease [Fictibacillus terranigra]|uniref:ABC transporter permease n=1 Tax=Fictibacillus terranigra TaxID=3058424 RepID=A0ABT8ECR6_9BACL|nr:ABC transporter permease [Fictibacillus sp. CENA-BCM004]MDN4075733.1 ABC transporter permease [Fictibacillus sp. CENA-BCM004]
MMNFTKIWQRRKDQYFAIALRYFRLIGNSGFMLSLYILFVMGSFYYARILKQLPDNFPASWLLIAVYAYLLTKSPVRTFLKKGDLVFLLPVESRMKEYFRHSIRYTAVIQSFSIVFFFLALGPLFSRFITDNPIEMLLTLALLLTAKVWNIKTSWEEQRLPFDQTRRNYMVIRLAVNAVFLFLLFQKAYVFILAILAIMYVLSHFFFGFIKKMHGYKWEHLLEIENGLMMKLYRIANLFTDVPQLSQKVKPRKWLTAFSKVPYKQRHTFEGLYRKTFFRSNDYFGIYIRLVIIGGLFLFWFPSGWWHPILILLFLHATGVQLLPLYRHHRGNVWFELYPVKHEWRFEAFQKWLRFLLLIQAFLYVAFLFLIGGTWMIGGLSAGSALLFVWLFTAYYTKKQIMRVM